MFLQTLTNFQFHCHFCSNSESKSEFIIPRNNWYKFILFAVKSKANEHINYFVIYNKLKMKEEKKIDVDVIIRESIRYFIVESKITAREFAKSCNVDETGMSNYLAKRRNISLNKLFEGLQEQGFSFKIYFHANKIVFESELQTIEYQYNID